MEWRTPQRERMDVHNSITWLPDSKSSAISLRAEPFDCQLRDAFKVLDKESTGNVSIADLRHVLTSIGEKLESQEFEEWIREVEVNPDGTIRYEDFILRMVAK